MDALQSIRKESRFTSQRATCRQYPTVVYTVGALPRGDFVDWGTAIDGKIWRTLSSEEWSFLLNTRKVNGDTGYGKTCTWATIKVDEDVTVEGLIIFCDGYQPETKEEEFVSIPDNCVFLPSAGRRLGKEYTECLYYWSATPSPETGRGHMAQYLSFSHNDSYTTVSQEIIGDLTRNVGCAVRLVTDVSE